MVNNRQWNVHYFTVHIKKYILTELQNTQLTL